MRNLHNLYIKIFVISNRYLKLSKKQKLSKDSFQILQTFSGYIIGKAELASWFCTKLSYQHVHHNNWHSKYKDNKQNIGEGRES